MDYKFTSVLILILIIVLLIRYSRETFQSNNAHTEIVLTFFEKLDKQHGVFYIDGKPIKPNPPVATEAPLQVATEAPLQVATEAPLQVVIFTIIAKSRGGAGGKEFAEFYIKTGNQSEKKFNVTTTRGYNILVLNADGSYNDFKNFDTHYNYQNTTNMINFIKSIPDGKIVAAAVKDDGEFHSAPGVTFYEHAYYDGNVGYVFNQKLNSDGTTKKIDMTKEINFLSNSMIPNDQISSFKIWGPIKLVLDLHNSEMQHATEYFKDEDFLGSSNDEFSYGEIRKLSVNDTLTTNEAFQLIGGKTTSDIRYRDGHAIVGVKGDTKNSASDNIIRKDATTGTYTTSVYAHAEKTFIY